MSSVMTGEGFATPAVVKDFRFKLGFFKLIVNDVERAIDFYRSAFGFEVRERLDFPHIEEAMLVLPGQAFNLVLYRWKDGRALTIGTGHGPIGLVTDDVDGAFAHAVKCGGVVDRRPFDIGPSRIAFLFDPEGHAIELIQFKIA